jgi:hypothetical protein
MKDYNFEHELARRRLWIEVCVAVARSENCVDVTAPTHWADKALVEFDERFSDLKKEESG